MTGFVEAVGSRVWGKTRLTTGALKGTLMVVLVPLFLGGLEGLDTFLGLLGLPTYPWILVTAEYLSGQFGLGVQVPQYVLRVGAVFTVLTILLAFAKYWLSDRFVESINPQNLGKLGRSEYWVVAFWLVAGPALLYLVNYPFAPVSVAQGVVFIGLQIAYGLVPGILVNTFVLPDETGSAIIKMFVGVMALGLTFVFTALALIGMESVELFL